MNKADFCLQDTAKLLQHADSALKLLLSVDCADITALHGAMLGIRYMLNSAINQLESVPESTLQTTHNLIGLHTQAPRFKETSAATSHGEHR